METLGSSSLMISLQVLMGGPCGGTLKFVPSRLLPFSRLSVHIFDVGSYILRIFPSDSFFMIMVPNSVYLLVSVSQLLMCLTLLNPIWVLLLCFFLVHC